MSMEESVINDYSFVSDSDPEQGYLLSPRDLIFTTAGPGDVHGPVPHLQSSSRRLTPAVSSPMWDMPSVAPATVNRRHRRSSSMPLSFFWSPAAAIPDRERRKEDEKEHKDRQQSILILSPGYQPQPMSLDSASLAEHSLAIGSPEVVPMCIMYQRQQRHLDHIAKVTAGLSDEPSHYGHDIGHRHSTGGLINISVAAVAPKEIEHNGQQVRRRNCLLLYDPVTC